MSTIPQFLQLLSVRGSDAVIHRDDSTVDCPCLTPEGFRDPEWHVAHPLAVVCNAQGKIPAVVSLTIKAFIQPAQSTRATRLTSEYIQQMFGTVRADDHFGILPLTWNGQTINYDDWSQNGEDFILYHNMKFFIVNLNIIPDPSDGADHHAEAGLRVIRG